MSSSRRISWSAACHAMKADRAVRAPVREERLRTSRYASCALTLSAWRGLSGRRYVVSVHLVGTDLADFGSAVVLFVTRDAAGIASLVADRGGASELHIHRLAETPAERAAVVADLLLDRTEIEETIEGLVTVLDAIDGDTDLEDGADAEPSLAAPEGHENQVGWCRGSDTDHEIAAPGARRLLALLDAVGADPKADIAQAFGETATVLARAAALLARPEAWCRAAGARDRRGNRVVSTDPAAVAWDLGGALDRAAGGNVALADAAENVLLTLVTHPAGLAAFNDEPTTSHTDILALLRA